MDRVLPPWLLLLSAALFAAACGEEGPTDLGPDAAALSVYLTDAPGEVEAVWLEILSASLEGDEGSVPLLGESTGLIEVTDLVGRAREIVDDAVVPKGRYGRLSLVIGGAVLETSDGGVYTREGAAHPAGLEPSGTLMCPSCSQSGLKVQLHGVEVGGDDHALVLDFDVSQSFGHQAGNSGRWIMRPVIHTDFDREDEDGRLDGESIEGTVTLAEGVQIPACPGDAARGLDDFIPTAVARNLTNDDGLMVIRSGNVDEDGEFEIDYLADDVYEMSYVPAIDFEGAALVFEAGVWPAEVTVQGEDVEGVAYRITAASCVPIP